VFLLQAPIASVHVFDVLQQETSFVKQRGMGCDWLLECESIATIGVGENFLVQVQKPQG
jgi:hypothetical protein